MSVIATSAIASVVSSTAAAAADGVGNLAGGKDDWRCVHLSGARPRAARGETAAVLGVATSVFRPIVPTTAARRTAAARVRLSTSIAGVRAVRFARRHHLDGGAVDAGDEGTTLVTFGRAFNRFALRESFFDALGGIVKHPASRAIFSIICVPRIVP